jgi:hypothetical protein
VELRQAGVSRGGSLSLSLNEAGDGEQSMEERPLTRSRARREAQDVDGGGIQRSLPRARQR